MEVEAASDYLRDQPWPEEGQHSAEGMGHYFDSSALAFTLRIPGLVIRCAEASDSTDGEGARISLLVFSLAG